ncbi:MAG: hypothetical protein J5666_09280, partial [Bacilli bacterium]|nr:hypothetical protein [Bacilli bacterium]
ITVLAYTFDGSAYEYTNAVTKNLADVARAEYNANATPADLVTTVAEAAKVKVTHDGGSVNYFGTLALASAAFADGDTVELVKGTYDDALTVSVNDLKLLGAAKDVAVTTSGNRNDSREETILTSAITVNDGVDGVEINGLKFTGSSLVNLKDDNSNIVFKYNNCVYSGNTGFTDSQTKGYANITHANIQIVNNYFKTTNASYSRDVYLQGFLDGMELCNNYFGSTATTLNDNGYTIKCNRLSNGSIINVKDNLFRNYNANYVIDFGYSANEGALVNIENNEMSSAYTKCLVGNGIRVANLKSNSIVSIIYNTKFRTSPYFNAIMLSCGTAANDTTSARPNIDIRFNKFYVEECAVADETKPASRDTVSSRYTRIGLGVPSDLGDLLVLEYNYFGSSTSRYAYTNNSSASAAKNTNQIDLKNNSTTTSDADSRYAAYSSSMSSFESTLETYLDEMGTLAGDVNAYYGGSGAADITSYISSFVASDGDLYQIKDGKLTFITDSTSVAGELFILEKHGVSSADSLKP